MPETYTGYKFPSDTTLITAKEHLNQELHMYSPSMHQLFQSSMYQVTMYLSVFALCPMEMTSLNPSRQMEALLSGDLIVPGLN